jgi:metallo-beta-lactamase class B
MMKRMAWIGMSLVAALAASPARTQGGDDPLLRPIAPASSARWLTPQPPTRIFGNTYLVGFGGLNVALIRTSAGLILIDAGVPQGVRAVEANIRRLGFRLRDVRFILSTEPHFDHAGGLAALVRDTGATVIASAPAAAVLRRGRSGPDDPQAAWLAPFPPVGRVRVVRDGEQLRLGDTVVTARATPGHTAGSMSWSWQACEGRRCASVVFGSSLTPMAAEGFNFSDPARAAGLAAFRRTFVSLRALPCDILLTAHPDHSDGDAKIARLQRQRDPNPFLDPASCRAYADHYAQFLDERLAEEAASRASR